MGNVPKHGGLAGLVGPPAPTAKGAAPAARPVAKPVVGHQGRSGVQATRW